MTIKNIMASFRTTGIFPLDQNKVLSLVNSVISTESPVSKPGGLTYGTDLMQRRNRVHVRVQSHSNASAITRECE